MGQTSNGNNLRISLNVQGNAKGVDHCLAHSPHNHPSSAALALSAGGQKFVGYIPNANLALEYRQTLKLAVQILAPRRSRFLCACSLFSQYIYSVQWQYVRVVAEWRYENDRQADIAVGKLLPSEFLPFGP